MLRCYAHTPSPPGTVFNNICCFSSSDAVSLLQHMLACFFESAAFPSNGISLFQADPCKGVAQSSSSQSLWKQATENHSSFPSPLYESVFPFFLASPVAGKIESWEYLVQGLIDFLPLAQFASWWDRQHSLAVILVSFGWRIATPPHRLKSLL